MQAHLQSQLPQSSAYSRGAVVLGLEAVILPCPLWMDSGQDILHLFMIHSIPSQWFRKRAKRNLHLRTPL